MRETSALLGVDTEISAEDNHLRDMCGSGYAIPSEEGNAAIALLAKEEGLFLDEKASHECGAEEIWFIKQDLFFDIHTAKPY